MIALLPAGFAVIVLMAAQYISPVMANWIAIGLFMAGVPHGAIERCQESPKYIMPTWEYTALYIVFAILVFAGWLISPLGMLALFLLLSAWHFGESEPDIKTVGLWVITGSCLLHASETLNIFAMLIGNATPDAPWVQGSFVMAGLVLALMCIEAWLRRRSGRPVSWVRLGFVIAMFLILPPIPAVAVYFFALHGMGECARTLRAVAKGKSELTARDIVWLYGPATLPAIIGATVMIAVTYMGYVPIPIAAGLGIAFIVPHMLPVEKLLVVDRSH